jgi:hypothetical protein
MIVLHHLHSGRNMWQLVTNIRPLYSTFAMPYPLMCTGTYRTINKLHACIIHDGHNQWIMPRQVFSIANKRIRLTREDGQHSLLAIATPCDDHGLYTVNRFSIRGEDRSCGARVSTFLINIDRSPGPGLVSASSAGRTGKKPDGRVQRRSVIMSARHSHLCLLLPCWIKWITNTRLTHGHTYDRIHVLGYICKHCSKTRRSRDLP